MEISNTQAAAAILGLNVSLSSELYTICDIDACINMIKNKQRFAADQLPINENNKSDSGYFDDSDNENDDDDDDHNSDVNSDAKSECKFSLINTEEDNNMGNNIVPDNSDNKVSNSSGILTALLNGKFMIQECNTNTMLHCIKTTLENANISLESPQMKFYTNAYGSSSETLQCPLNRSYLMGYYVPRPQP